MQLHPYASQIARTGRLVNGEILWKIGEILWKIGEIFWKILYGPMVLTRGHRGVVVNGLC